MTSSNSLSSNRSAFAALSLMALSACTHAPSGDGGQAPGGGSAADAATGSGANHGPRGASANGGAPSATPGTDGGAPSGGGPAGSVGATGGGATASDGGVDPGGAAPGARGAIVTGNATHFDGLGQAGGGCGVPQGVLESQSFVALNVQDTPGDYTSMPARPLEAGSPIVGMYANGKNCGRWIHVTVGDYCDGTNDGAESQSFCRKGTGAGWVADEYTGASLDFLVADSCQDGNAWCRDDRFHVDLATSALSSFVKGGATVPGLASKWNNRQVRWQFTTAPGYQGDVRIGLGRDAQPDWVPVVLTHLPNGIHGVERDSGKGWVAAAMNSDNGQVYLMPPGPPPYRIRIYDADDKLVQGGRVYSFDFPASCNGHCTDLYTDVTYQASP